MSKDLKNACVFDVCVIPQGHICQCTQLPVGCHNLCKTTIVYFMGLKKWIHVIGLLPHMYKILKWRLWHNRKGNICFEIESQTVQWYLSN